MRDDSPEKDPKAIWQNQPTEASAVTLEKLKQMSRDLHVRTRRQLLGTLIAPLAVVFFGAFGLSSFPALRPTLQPLFALALVWSLAGLYLLNRSMWPIGMPEEMGLATGLEFCRRQIERRQFLLQRVLLWSFGPILLALAIFILGLAMIGSRGRGLIPNGLPFLTLVIAWIVGYFIVRVQERRRLRKDFDELNGLERENTR